ncbi:importin subunit alpha-1-like [Penaeus indicus]|uniref:importin subunit alpha-1-like n=1 Tax=Penaeus indicus TaxID=29960 RepID=UPI00300D6448
MEVSTIRVVAWVLANIFRNKNLTLTPEQLKESIATLKVLVNYRDEEVNVDALWALSYLSEQGDEEIEGVLREDLLPVIVRHLGSDRSQMIVPALRASGNIVSGNDLQTEAALAAGVLPLYKQLLRNTRRNIRKETAWALSNVTAGTRGQIQQVVDEDLLLDLVIDQGCITFFNNLIFVRYQAHHAETGITLIRVNVGMLLLRLRIVKMEYRQDFIRAEGGTRTTYKRKRTWALSNLTSGGTPSQIEALVAAGGVEALVTVLGVFETSVVTVALEGLDNILAVSMEVSVPTVSGTGPTRFKKEYFAMVLKQLCGKGIKGLCIIVCRGGCGYAECGDKQAIVQKIAEAGGKEKLEILQRNTDETVSNKAKGLLEMHFDNKRDNSDESDNESQEDALDN